MEEKIYIVLAGVNGAGKSTFRELFGGYAPLFSFCDSERFRRLQMVNPDQYTSKIGSWESGRDQFAGGRNAIEDIRENFAQGISFCQETTLSGFGIVRNIKLAKKLGYKVGIVYIGLENVEIAKSRVTSRVEKGGHGIPEKDIERHYTNSFVNLNKVKKHCHEILLYDNSSEKGLHIVGEYDAKGFKILGGHLPFPNWVMEHAGFLLEKSKDQIPSLDNADEKDFDELHKK